MVVRAAVVGISEGNGHPFSFSAIVNGYSPTALANSGWPGIYDYVRRRDPSEFGFEGFTITHAWTQDTLVTRSLCEACLIPHAAARLDDLLGQVDAVILARDDHEKHAAMAMPFLKAGLHVFVDKPLSLDLDELRMLKPFLETGQLMSCSGMRFAKELDEPRLSIGDYGPLTLIRGAIVLSWEKYGVHLLDAILSMVKARPVSATALMARHASIAIRLEGGMLLQIDALGDAPRTFRIDIWGTQRASTHEITDNFSMFRRMLWHFADSIRTRKPAIPAQDTLDIMRTLIAGRRSLQQGRTVLLDEIQL